MLVLGLKESLARASLAEGSGGPSERVKKLDYRIKMLILGIAKCCRPLPKNFPKQGNNLLEAFRPRRIDISSKMRSSTQQAHSMNFREEVMHVLKVRNPDNIIMSDAPRSRG